LETNNIDDLETMIPSETVRKYILETGWTFTDFQKAHNGAAHHSPFTAAVANIKILMKEHQARKKEQAEIDAYDAYGLADDMRVLMRVDRKKAEKVINKKLKKAKYPYRFHVEENDGSL